MRWIALALALLASSEASAHCYSVWRYPWKQRCGAARQTARLTILHSVAATSVPNQEHSKNKADTADIPLPSLARTDCDGGEADEPTRARILLRAALEAANGH